VEEKGGERGSKKISVTRREQKQREDGGDTGEKPARPVKFDRKGGREEGLRRKRPPTNHQKK